MSSVLQVVSYPKSGRTWLRVMLDDLGIEAVYTHDGSGYEDGASAATLAADKTRYAAGPLLLMVRDPRDVVVSGYFQVQRRLRLPGTASMSMRAFIRNKNYGIENVVRFNLLWFAAGRGLSGFAIVQYEDLHEETARTLSAVARFARRNVPAAAIRSAVSRNAHTRMRKLEASGILAERYGNALMPSDPHDPESYKVRRGIVGGYVEYLSSDDIDYCDRLLAKANYFSRLQAALCQWTVLKQG